ncbi:MAG: exonuclease domain-containing protein [Bacteroidota bacterium]
MSKPTRYAIIDLETTGGDPKKERITEIAVYLYDGEKVIDSFTTLVNPERPIPPFITGITGIDNDMVKDAPRFYEVARRVVEITQDAVFVAHNVRFDYSFIQKEFRQLGYKYSRKQLCTANLSRKLLPDMPSYSLGNLCKELGIENRARHRADGDAAATVELFDLLLKASEPHRVRETVDLELAMTKLPPKISKEVVDELPDETGVYYFHDAQGEVLYVGKSNQIRKRVLSHFQGAYKAARTMQMFERIHDISFELTGSELIALLFENEEIKRLLPPYNRAQRRRKYRLAVYTVEDKNGYLRMEVGKYDEERRPILGFSSQSSAEAALKRWTQEHQLCLKLMGIERGKGRCFYQQLHICQGACMGEEDPESYNQRVRNAVSVLSYGQGDMDNFLVVGEGKDIEECSVVWVEKGFYRGFTYLDRSMLNGDPQQIIEAIPFKPETPDVQRIIRGYIRKNTQEVMRLSNIPTS